jgi:uncharacterized protein with gpF-like domain
MAETTRARLDRLLRNADKQYREAFYAYVREVRSSRVMDEIVEALENRDYSAAISIVQSHVQAFGTVLPTVFQAAAVEAFNEMAPSVSPSIGYAFDPTNPRAARMMRAEQLSLIREFSRTQVEVVREALAEAFEAGEGSVGVARRIRNVVGLTSRQAGAIANYRRLLASGNLDALTRDLRDRRFDRTVRAAARAKRALTASEIDRMVDRYRERYLQYRAEMIARTESTRVTNLARQEAFEQTLEQTGTRRDRVLRIWNATQDHRTREAHADMQGQERHMDEPFEDGDGNALRFPGDPTAPPETVIQCRCVLTMRFKRSEQPEIA